MPRRRKETAASDPQARRKPRPSIKLAAVWLTLSNGVIVTEPVGETQDEARGLAERLYDIIGAARFPQKRLESLLAQVTEPPVLAVKPGRKGFSSPDIAGVLQELVKRGGTIPAGGLVQGTAAVVRGPGPDEAPAAWLYKILNSSTLWKLTGKGAREQRDKGRGEQTADQAMGELTLSAEAARDALAAEHLASLEDLTCRLIEMIRPFREEFRQCLGSMQGFSFGRRNAEAVEEINTLLGLLGMHLRDPNEPSLRAYLVRTDVPGTKGGNMVIRREQDSNRKREILSARTSLPDNILSYLEEIEPTN